MGIVADDHDVAVTNGEKVDDLGLQAVRVLIFVNQNVLKLVGVEVGDLAFLDKQTFYVDQQIVVIHHVPLLLP